MKKLVTKINDKITSILLILVLSPLILFAFTVGGAFFGAVGSCVLAKSLLID